jgi:hypothetical protein
LIKSFDIRDFKGQDAKIEIEMIIVVAVLTESTAAFIHFLAVANA